MKTIKHCIDIIKLSMEEIDEIIIEAKKSGFKLIATIEVVLNNYVRVICHEKN